MKTIFTFPAILLASTICAQNTGIGISLPTEKLHIDSGNIKIGSKPLMPGKTHLLKFGDQDFVHIGEAGNDSLELKATNFTFFGSYGVKTNIDLYGSLHINGSLIITDSLQVAGKLSCCNTGECCYPPSYRSGFNITKSEVQAIPSGYYTPVIFDSEIYDDAGAFAASTFTAPANGLYHFDIKLLYNLNSAPVRYTQVLGLFTDDEEITRTQQLVDARINSHNSIGLNADCKLLAGQVVSVYTYQDSGIPQAIVPVYNVFSGHRVY